MTVCYQVVFWMLFFQIVNRHGPEADRHLLRCLFSHVDFSGDGKSSGKDFHQVKFALRQLLVNVACYQILLQIFLFLAQREVGDSSFKQNTAMTLGFSTGSSSCQSSSLRAVNCCYLTLKIPWSGKAAEVQLLFSPHTVLYFESLYLSPENFVPVH